MRCKEADGMNKIRVSELPHIEWDHLPLMVGKTAAAALIGVSPSFLDKARSEGTRGNRTDAPPFVPVGGRRLYRVADLKAWVEGLQGRAAI
jgi:hypothetical protein